MNSGTARRLALLAAFASVVGCRGGPPGSIVLVSLDTVRADHLEPYGYTRPTSPRLAELAARSLVFTNAYAQDTNTQPSHATVLTGLYPAEHAALENGIPLPPSVPTLAERLRAEGWATAAFVSGSPLRSSLSGLDRGFDVFDDEFDGARRDGSETVRRALHWWRSTGPAKRFLLVHLYDAHGPYRPRPDLAPLFRSATPGEPVRALSGYQRTTRTYGDLAELTGTREFIDAYDGALRGLDELVGEMMHSIDLEATALVVFADHGETLDEREWPFDHGARLFEEQTRVPLLLSVPGIRPARVSAIVELIDLFPTVLRIADAPPRAGSRPIHGFDLLQVANGQTRRPPSALSSARPVPERLGDGPCAISVQKWRLQALRAGPFKMILYPCLQGDAAELYDLRSDPGERRPLGPADYPEIAEDLLRTLRRAADAGHVAPYPRQELPPEEAERLRSLGYL